MLAAIVWKEIREQWLIGVSLVVLGSGVLAAAATLADPPLPESPRSDVVRNLGAGFLATLMLSVTAGMVCGGAVFAAEREAGTMGFLESLPATRWQLWVGKLTAGFGLALVQVTLLVAVAALLGLLPSLAGALAVLVCALLAFFWGVFGSTTARTTLGSVGFAIPFAALTALLVLAVLAVFSRGIGMGILRPVETLIFLVVMTAVPLVLSAWLFTAPDRARSGEAVPAAGPVPAGDRGRSRSGLRALVWLTVRQLRVPSVVLCGFAVLAGLTLLPRTAQPLLTWPGLALLAGVLAGVLVLGDEQTRGSARYWGEQRLPVGRLWAVKLGLHAAFALGLLLLLAGPLVIRSQVSPVLGTRGYSPLASVFGTLLFEELGRVGWWYLLLPAVYGFAAGHLCGVLFRKLVVACGVAGIVGGFASVAWGPSLLAGGVRSWQLLLPPLLLLLTARALLPFWAADTLTARPALGRLAFGSLAALQALAAGLAYRVLEVPDRADTTADIEYVTRLPSIDDNPGWRLRTASERFVVAALNATPERDQPVSLTAAGATDRRSRFEERLDLVIRNGWPPADKDKDLGPWLDRVFRPSGRPGEPDWFTVVEEVTGQRVGVYEYPQLVGLSGPRDGALQNGVRMVSALLARGLQKQADGDPGEFLVRFRQALHVGRTMQNGTIVVAYLMGTDVIRLALTALDRWLERLGDDPVAAGLLRRALGLLEAVDPPEPFDPTPYYLSERYVLREGLAAPSQWLPQLLTPPGGDPEAVGPVVDLVALAWAVPWERERTRRLVGLGYESGRSIDLSLIAGRPGARMMLRPRFGIDPTAADRNLRLLGRVGLLKVALRAYRCEHGRYPDALAGLVVSGYLRAVPGDPYEPTRPLGYRLSPGETLRSVPSRGMGEPPPLARAVEWVVPPGQPVLWSVGIDALDQGGTSLPADVPLTFGTPPDFVFLVPSGAGAGAGGGVKDRPRD